MVASIWVALPIREEAVRRVYVTVTKRMQEHAPASTRDRSSLVVLDWDAGAVVAQHWIEVTRGSERGQSRGCRGLAVHDGALYVAVHPDVLQRRNLDALDVEEEFRVPGLVEVHQLQSRGGALWVISTGSNEVLLLRKHEVAERRTALTPRAEEYVSTWRLGDAYSQDRLHFNSIGWGPNGEELHVYSDSNAVFDATAQRVAWFGHPLHKPHNACYCSAHEVVVNSSAVKMTVVLDLVNHVSRTIYRDDRVPPSNGVDVALVGWTRGLALHGRTAFIGVAPGEAVAVDVPSGEVVGRVSFSDDPRDAPFAVLLDPRDWK